MDITEVRPGNSVVVLHGGLIGLLAVQLARIAGTAAVVVTRYPGKRALALRLGATAAVDPSPGDVEAAIHGADDLLHGGAHREIEAAGVCETIEQAPRFARRGVAGRFSFSACCRTARL